MDLAIDILKNGGVVAMPTETVYGLAGDVEQETAIKKIFSTKERPFFDPLIVHISSIEQAKKLTTQWDETCEKLAESFWPGPLTLILPKSDLVNPLITSGLNSVGLRWPNHALAMELISNFNLGLAAPSANKFKKTSPTSKEHVEAEFGNNVFVLDGGKCEVGIESTVAGVFKDRIEIYRPGMISLEDISLAVLVFYILPQEL